MKKKAAIWVVLVLSSIFGVLYIHLRSKGGTNTSTIKANETASKSKHLATSPAPLQIVNIPAQDLSSNVQLVLAPEASYEDRSRAVKTVSTNLTTEDSTAIYSFLLKRVDEDDHQLGQVLKNQLMDQLCSLNPPPAGLADLLSQIYHDQSQNGVIRDYAVQHLVAFCLQMEVASAEVLQQRNPELVDAQSVLWEALGETQNSIAGTALLGLERLSESGVEIKQDDLGKAALQLANDASAGEMTHITAYQVCGKLNLQGALSAIENAAQDSSTIPVQISAIGALGSMGGANDLPILQSLLSQGEQRLQIPLQEAIKRIEARIQTPAR